MTRGTHQVAAFTFGLGALVLAQSAVASASSGLELSELAKQADQFLGLPLDGRQIPWPVALLYVLFAILGGLAPDIDKSSQLWARLLSATALGGHRHLSHSLLGAGLAAALFFGVLAMLGSVVALPIGLLWLAFVAGYLSHLFADSLTHEGIPLLFPWGFFLGLPPSPSLRLRTGGWIEEFVVLPALLIFIAWLGFSQGQFLTSLWR